MRSCAGGHAASVIPAESGLGPVESCREKLSNPWGIRVFTPIQRASGESSPSSRRGLHRYP
jgi:hypothetical protein